MSYKWNHNFPKIARDAGFTIRELSIGHCIDWRFIASIDPYNIVNEQDYEKLDEFIPHISEVPIGTVLNNRILDPAIGKYFILAQFSIQYLLFCKQFLDETVVEIRNSFQEQQTETVRLEKICKKRNEEIAALHRKLQRTEHLQHLPSPQAVVYPCTKCTKNFISTELLNAHMVRKHLDSGAFDACSGRKLSETDSNLINTIKLELEVKQLKERLNAAEKNLMGQQQQQQQQQQPSQEHRCHRCAVEPWPKKSVQTRNASVQDNFEDEKDFDEKEVQTVAIVVPEVPEPLPVSPGPPLDYISKSDLISIFREQQELFESWKANERRTLVSEIEVMKQNLADAIGAMERSERVTPVPVSEPVVESVTVPEPNIWKERFHELEQMYQNSQKQMRDTVENIESLYEGKLKQFEKLLQKSETERRQSLPAVAIPRLARASFSEIQPTHLIREPPKANQRTTLPADPVPLATIEDSADDGALADVVSSEDHSDSDEDAPAPESGTNMKEVFTVKSQLEEAAKEPPTAPKTTLLISPKQQILQQFKMRLKALGIDPKTKKLPQEDLHAAVEALALKRDAQKKKHRTFFITRNQLLSKVDQMARAKIGEPLPVTRKPPKPASSGVTTEQHAETIVRSPKRAASVDLSAMKLAGKSLSIFKSKSPPVPVIKMPTDDIITVQADISSHSPVAATVVSVRTKPTSPSYEQQLESLLETPVKSLETMKPASGHYADGRTLRKHEEHLSDISELLDFVPLQPKPIPKKRVLFNLDQKEGESNVTLVAARTVPQSRNATITSSTRLDDDSDWNISSFEEEK